MSPKSVTLLTCQPEYRASKVVSKTPKGGWDIKPYNAGKCFYQDVKTVETVDELFDLLNNLNSRPQTFIIRGHANPHATRLPGGLVRRIKIPRPKEGIHEPFFLERPKQWVMLDFDKLPMPSDIPPVSKEAIERAISVLPPVFADVSYVYSFSSSAGLYDTSSLSAHVWFMLDKPLGELDLKAWLGEHSIDVAVFQTVQPHYTAAPIFSAGIVDPVHNRTGIVRKSYDEVTVPAIDTQRQKAVELPPTVGSIKSVGGYEERLAHLGDGPNGQGLHGVITSLLAYLAATAGAALDWPATKRDIRARAATATWDAEKHSDAYVAHETSDRELDRSWTGALEKFAPEMASIKKLPERMSREQADFAIKKFTRQWFVAATAWNQDANQKRSEDRPFDWPDPETIATLAHELKVSSLRPGAVTSAPGGQGKLTVKPTTKGGEGFFSRHSRRSDSRAPIYALQAQVGLGKTQTLIALLPDMLAALRHGRCVAIAVPNHKLSKELEARLRAAGIAAEVYLGPAQPDPQQPEVSMCQELELFERYQNAGIAPKLCTKCEKRTLCGYQRQQETKSDVWIVAHAVLYSERRRPVPPVDFLIIDESPVAAGASVVEIGDLQTLPAEINRAVTSLSRDGNGLRGDLIGQLERTERELRRSLSKLDICEPTAPSTLAELDRRADDLRLIAFLREMIKFRFTSIKIVTVNNTQSVMWHRQKVIHKSYDAPTLVLDAPLNTDLLRFVLRGQHAPPRWQADSFTDTDGSISYVDAYPEASLLVPSSYILVEEPHAKIRQIPWSAAASKLGDDATGQNNVRRLLRYIEGRSAFFRRVLVICQKNLEDRLNQIGLPPHVETAHFNAIRGNDSWKGVDLLVVIGRTQPPPESVEKGAEALFRTPIESIIPDYYQNAQKVWPGTDCLARCEIHPDALAEMVRQSACENEVLQAIGRARAVNRTERNPVQIDIINLVPLAEVVIDEIIEWPDAEPSAVEVIAGRHGLVLTAEPNTKGYANILAALLPDRYKNANTARQAPARSRAILPNKILLGKIARERELGYWTQDARVRLQARGARYAIEADLFRPFEWHPIADGESLPKAAIVEAGSVAMIGEIYVLMGKSCSDKRPEQVC